ncbi:MAG: hypothetical protein HY913_22995 [Desulfomonile tiedjei]|nr:hypothetical protein [Desulfomonile tiedjei]
MTKEMKAAADLIKLAMEGLGVAVTIIDTEGTLLHYNKQAAKILDRKPVYVGNDVHSHTIRQLPTEN